MIFVTVGTHDRGFDRLVRAADELAQEVEEEVVIQRGSGEYVPGHAKYFEWSSSAEIKEWIRQSRVVISHAGAGTIMEVVDQNKPLVIVPRLSKFKEVINDHQLQLASKMDERERAAYVAELSAHSLLEAINKAVKQVATSGSSRELTGAIQNKLMEWEKELH